MSAEETSPLLVALRDQLRSILEKPITARMFLELEQTAKLARNLLMISKMPDANGLPGAGDGLVSPLSLSDSSIVSYGSGYGYGSLYGPGVMAPSSQTETFGATMVRELVAALPALMKPKETVVRESASSLVEAIASARENKLDDIAVKLKARLDALLDDPESAGVPAPKPLLINAESAVTNGQVVGVNS